MKDLLTQLSDKVGKQKSQSWLDWRQDKITGTDMHTLFSNSDNPDALQALLQKKLGFEPINKFEGNEMTDHGNYYEDVAVQKYEELTGKKIHLFNGLPHKTCPNVGCSPDGIVFDGNNTILIEIKCPYSRKIDEKIATPYKYQVQTGMEVLHSWGAPNVSTHFVQFKPNNWGNYSSNEILSINIIERDVEIGKAISKKATEFFEWVNENKDVDFDGFLDI